MVRLAKLKQRSTGNIRGIVCIKLDSNYKKQKNRLFFFTSLINFLPLHIWTSIQRCSCMTARSALTHSSMTRSSIKRFRFHIFLSSVSHFVRLPLTATSYASLFRQDSFTFDSFHSFTLIHIHEIYFVIQSVSYIILCLYILY